jgi:hypothetical protein
VTHACSIKTPYDSPRAMACVLLAAARQLLLQSHADCWIDAVAWTNIVFGTGTGREITGTFEVTLGATRAPIRSAGRRCLEP